MLPDQKLIFVENIHWIERFEWVCRSNLRNSTVQIGQYFKSFRMSRILWALFDWQRGLIYGLRWADFEPTGAHGQLFQREKHCDVENVSYRWKSIMEFSMSSSRIHAELRWIKGNTNKSRISRADSKTTHYEPSRTASTCISFRAEWKFIFAWT